MIQLYQFYIYIIYIYIFSSCFQWEIYDGEREFHKRWKIRGQWPETCRNLLLTHGYGIQPLDREIQRPCTARVCWIFHGRIVVVFVHIVRINTIRRYVYSVSTGQFLKWLDIIVEASFTTETIPRGERHWTYWIKLFLTVIQLVTNFQYNLFHLCYTFY